MIRYRDTYAKVRLDYIKENVETLYLEFKLYKIPFYKYQRNFDYSRNDFNYNMLFLSRKN